MHERASGRSRPSGLRPLVAAAILLAALLALWGFLRGTSGQVRNVMEGIKQITPPAEERNRMIQDLTGPPNSPAQPAPQ